MLLNKEDIFFLKQYFLRKLIISVDTIDDEANEDVCNEHINDEHYKQNDSNSNTLNSQSIDIRNDSNNNIEDIKENINKSINYLYALIFEKMPSSTRADKNLIITCLTTIITQICFKKNISIQDMISYEKLYPKNNDDNNDITNIN